MANNKIISKECKKIFINHFDCSAINFYLILVIEMLSSKLIESYISPAPGRSEKLESGFYFFYIYDCYYSFSFFFEDRFCS